MDDRRRETMKDVVIIVLRRYKVAIGTIFFLVGVSLWSLSSSEVGFGWELVKSLGGLMASVIAVSFVYEMIIKDEDRKVFLSELENVLEKKSMGSPGQGVRIIGHARIPIEKKVDIIQGATCEVIEMGTALHTFSAYFEQRGSYEFKDYVFRLLKSGVYFRCLFMDPDCLAAKRYSEDIGEIQLIEKMRLSCNILQGIQGEAIKLGLRGRLEIYLSPHIPHYHAVCVDGETVRGKIVFSPYLYGNKRPENPCFELSRGSDPVVFDKMWESIKKCISNSRPLGPYSV